VTLGRDSVTLPLPRPQEGLTPLDLAREAGHANIVLMLEAGRTAAAP